MQEIGSGFFVVLGALVGAFASVGTVTIQAYITGRREKSERDRERIERMYRLLKQLYVCVEAAQSTADRWEMRLPDTDGSVGSERNVNSGVEQNVQIVSEVSTLQQLYFPQLSPWHSSLAVLVAAHGKLCDHLTYDVLTSPLPITRERYTLSRQKYDEFLQAWRAYLDQLKNMIKS